MKTKKGRTFLRLRNSLCILLIIFFTLVFIPFVTSEWNPYEILGVKRDANLDQIKRAYRELARKLHPDKSSPGEDEAGRRFIELNKAFSILKDPYKRSRFDQHGDIEENRHSRYREKREYWNQNGFRTFTLYPASDGYLRKKSITSKQYYNEFLKESKKRPFLVFFYSDFCPSCTFIESTWAKIIDEVGKYGVRSFTVNIQHESRLAGDLGVRSVPLIACLVDGKLKKYHYQELSISSMIKFIKNSLPSNFVSPIKTETEESYGLLERVLWRFTDYLTMLVDYILSLPTLFLPILCALISGLFLYYTPSSQPSFTQDDLDNEKAECNRPEPSTSPSERLDFDGLKIIELKAETYNGMVRLLKPGHRSIVLLCDRETLNRLLLEFKRAVWPYRRNKTLLFGYLCLDKNLIWYKSLLQEVLGVDDLNVNKKNCIGTVLSLNGFKKYLRVYHDKHHEIDYYDDDTDHDGSFLGFNDDGECDLEGGATKESKVEDLLKKLPIWLDKMFDGLTKRYFLDDWPTDMN